jgi:uncharacterized metal-binding protein
MRGGFPVFEELYNADDTAMAHLSAIIEAEGYCRWTRVEEVAEFAHRMGWTCLGLAHCDDTRHEAHLAASYFSSVGLDSMLPPQAEACDPERQGAYFAGEGCTLNVICGMCPAHEAIFTRTSQAPVTGLVARDTRLRHNPVAALYTSDGYSHDLVYGRRAPGEGEFRGWDVSDLERAALGVHGTAPGDSNRLQDVMEYARALGARHLGISFCVGLRSEARVLTKILQANGFDVSSACCKTGAIPKEVLGIADSQKVRPGQQEMTCNPIAQAELLNREGVQLAMVLGQCVGHDAATLAHLDAPAVTLVVKDRVLAHNTVAALYDRSAQSKSL